MSCLLFKGDISGRPDLVVHPDPGLSSLVLGAAGTPGMGEIGFHTCAGFSLGTGHWPICWFNYYFGRLKCTFNHVVGLKFAEMVIFLVRINNSEKPACDTPPRGPKITHFYNASCKLSRDPILSPNCYPVRVRCIMHMTHYTVSQTLAGTVLIVSVQTDLDCVDTASLCSQWSLGWMLVESDSVSIPCRHSGTVTRVNLIH
jgi:hypothetical protein